MNNIKIITLFQYNQNIPFMTCIVKDIEENEQGMKFILENSNNIYVKDYDSFFLSESADDYDKARMINVYGGFISELSQVSEETVKSLILDSISQYDAMRENINKIAHITDGNALNRIAVRHFEVADSDLVNRSFRERNFFIKK